MMKSGTRCAEITIVRRVGAGMLIGLARPTLDPGQAGASMTQQYWGLGSSLGTVFHNLSQSAPIIWDGAQGFTTVDVLRMLLDSDAGILTVKVNGERLGTSFTSGLTGNLCWAACLGADNADDDDDDDDDDEEEAAAVRITAVDPVDF